MEALIGSVYLDGGYDAARRVILKLYQESLDRIPPFDELKDPKTRLQEYMQSQRLPLPEYEIVEITGEQHNKTFKVSCNVEGLEKPTFGTARSRRKAEQISAREALAILMDEQ